MKLLATFVAAFILGTACASDEADVVKILPLPEPIPLPMPEPIPLPMPEPIPLPEPLPRPMPIVRPEPLPIARPEPLPVPECSIKCPMIYKPVCGLPENHCGDCRTFGNSCSLRSYNCNNPNNKYYIYTNGACDQIGKAVLPIQEADLAVSEL